MLYSVDWLLVTDVLAQPVSPFFKCQAAQDCLTLEDET
jgi:hypothetical protein